MTSVSVKHELENKLDSETFRVLGADECPAGDIDVAWDAIYSHIASDILTPGGAGNKGSFRYQTQQSLSSAPASLLSMTALDCRILR